MDKLQISNEMREFDLKNRNFFDELTDEERKKFSPFLMIRWGSLVEGSNAIQEYYLMSTNERLNRNFFDISGSKHKKFQWLLATTVSPGLGPKKHRWLASKKRESNNKTEKFLRELRPDLKSDDIALLAKLHSKAELRQVALDHGWDDKQIKEYF